MFLTRELSKIYTFLNLLALGNIVLLSLAIGAYFTPWSYKNCSMSSDCNDSNPCTDDTCSNFICKYTLKEGATCTNNGMCGTNEACNSNCQCGLTNQTGIPFILPTNISTFVDIDVIKVAPNSPAGNQRFGSAVAACGQFVFIGSERQGGMGGAVYIYDVSLDDFNLFAVQIQILSGLAGSHLGFSLSVSNDCTYLVAGAPDLDPSNRGGFFIYKRNVTDPSQYDLFQIVTTTSTVELGFSIKISNNSDLTIISGDPNNNNAKVFNYNSTTDQWQFVQTITGNGTIAGDNFGTSIDIIDDLAIIGATNQDSKGAAYIFRRISGSWVNTEIIRASDKVNGDGFGSCVSLYQGDAVVGAVTATRGGISSGAAYLFNSSSGLYIETQIILPSSLGNTARFGSSCSFNNLGCAIIGAPEYDSSLGNNIGIAIVYALQNNQLVEYNRIIDYVIVVNGRIGSSVYMSDNITVVGAPTYNNVGVASGVSLLRTISIPVFIQSTVDCFRYFPTINSVRIWCQGNISGEFNPGIYYVVVDGSSLPVNSSNILDTWHTFSAFGRSNSGNSLVSVLNPQVSVNNIFTAYIITYGSIEINVVTSSLRRLESINTLSDDFVQ